MEKRGHGTAREGGLEKVLRNNRVAAWLLNPTFENPVRFDMPAERKEKLVKML